MLAVLFFSALYVVCGDDVLDLRAYTATVRVLPGSSPNFNQFIPANTGYDWTKPFLRIKGSGHLWEQLIQTPTGNNYWVSWATYPGTSSPQASEMVWKDAQGNCKSACGFYALPGYFDLPNSSHRYNGTNAAGNRIFLFVQEEYGWFKYYVAEPDVDLLVSYGYYALKDGAKFDFTPVSMPGLTDETPILMPDPSLYESHYIIAMRMTDNKPPTNAIFPGTNSKPYGCPTAQECGINTLNAGLADRVFVPDGQCCSVAGGWCGQNSSDPAGATCRM